MTVATATREAPVPAPAVETAQREHDRLAREHGAKFEEWTKLRNERAQLLEEHRRLAAGEFAS